MIRGRRILAGAMALVGFTVPCMAADAPPNMDFKVAAPEIPDAKFNLKDFGAVGDYKAFDTDAIKKAIEAVAKAGGGHLIVPEGTYKTLPFTLVSHMDLHLEAGAVIKAPNNFKEYGLPDPNENPMGGRGGGRGGGGVSPLISGRNITDIAITGPGKIDGSGNQFWIWSDKAARQYPEGRTYMGSRPNLINLSGIQRLHVEGVTLTNSPMFHLVPDGDDMLIENIRIVAPSDAPNSDAIDPRGNRIIIRNCEIDTGDDNVAIHTPSTDILIEDLICLHGHGISVGSGTRGGLKNVVVRRCSFDGTDNGIRLKSYRGSGGELQDLWYTDITMKNVRRPFDINMLYNGNAGGPTDVGPRAAEGQPNANLPNFHDIHVTNLTVTKSPVAGRIIGLPELMPNNIIFKNVKIQSDRGFLIQDGKDITFDGVEIKAAVGDPIVTDNGSLKFNGKEMTGTSGGSPAPWY